MSQTKVDLPKVAQMLDAGWEVNLFKNCLGSYTAIATHWRFAKKDMHETDDFTPEQALTRLAYKIYGEIL